MVNFYDAQNTKKGRAVGCDPFSVWKVYFYS